MNKSERKRQIPYDITYMWNLKYDTNELICETETDSQTQRIDLWLPRGRGVGREAEADLPILQKDKKILPIPG